MQSISFYLPVYSAIEPVERVVKHAVREAIIRATNRSVEDVAITISGRMVFIAAHPLLKTELYTRREEITACLNELLAGRRPRGLQ
jgi:hypothetical protein